MDLTCEFRLGNVRICHNEIKGLPDVMNRPASVARGDDALPDGRREEG